MEEKVLLVEDDPSIRDVAALGLRGAGFDVDTSPDGRDALARFGASPPDLVRLDMMRPELDGLVPDGPAPRRYP